MTQHIYGLYSEMGDITFIMSDTFDENGEIKSTEVVGFVYGNEVDNSEILDQYTGGLKAEY